LIVARTSLFNPVRFAVATLTNLALGRQGAADWNASTRPRSWFVPAFLQANAASACAEEQKTGCRETARVEQGGVNDAGRKSGAARSTGSNEP
jgi:hypothetical protein